MDLEFHLQSLSDSGDHRRSGGSIELEVAQNGGFHRRLHQIRLFPGQQQGEDRRQLHKSFGLPHSEPHDAGPRVAVTQPGDGAIP